MTSPNPYAPTSFAPAGSSQSAMEIGELPQQQELTKTRSEPAKFAAGLFMAVAALVATFSATFLLFVWHEPPSFEPQPPEFSLTQRFILSTPPALILVVMLAWLVRLWKQTR